MKCGLAITVLSSIVSAMSLDQMLAVLTGSAQSPAIRNEIPGESPIETCLDDTPQLVELELIEIDPNPPIPGANFTISARGTLKEDVVDGSYVDVIVRYGFITLVNKRYDLCELLLEVNLECPLKAGYVELTRSVEIPKEVPPGEYTADAKAYTPEDALLTCLTAEVEIKG